MTIRREFNPDVAADPDWPLFSESTVAPLPEPLAMLGLYATRDQWNRAISEVINEFTSPLKSILFDTEPVASLTKALFKATGPWNLSSAVARHQQMWRHVSNNATIEDFGRASCYKLLGEESDTRFAALLELSPDMLDVALDAARTEAFIIATGIPLDSWDSEVTNLFSAALPDDGAGTHVVDWGSLTALTCPRGDIVTRVIQDIDYHTFAIELFGLQSILGRL